RGILFVHVELAPDAEPSATAEEEEPALVPREMPVGDPAQPVAQLLHDERFLLRKLIDAVPDPIFCKDREGRYLLRNAADLKMFDVPGDQALGLTVRELPG